MDRGFRSDNKQTKHRIYATKEEAEAVMKDERQKRDAGSTGRSPRWY